MGEAATFAANAFARACAGVRAFHSFKAATTCSRMPGSSKFGTSAGLVTGGNLRSLKNMSDSTKKRLKQSRAFQGLSRAERDRLRRQFRGR